MTLDQLITLDAIVAIGTFRGAADRLNKAQSAVSHQIRKLEEELSFSLFSRDEYRPILTPEGEVFFREATRVLEQFHALKATAASLTGEQEPVIRISMTATMSFDPVMDLFGHVKRTYPGTHLQVTTEMMGGPIERLLNDEADMILAGLHGVEIHEVETIPVGTTTIRPVAHHTFPKAEFTGVRSRREMQTYTQVVVSGTGSREFDQSRDVVSGAQRWTVSDFATKKSVIKAGLGWGGIPEHLISEELASGELVTLNVEGFPPRHTDIYAIRRRDRVMGQVMSTIWSKLLEQANR